MGIGLIFWVVMLIWALFSCWSYWPSNTGAGPPWASSFLLFVLFLLLGWGVFGAPVRG